MLFRWHGNDEDLRDEYKRIFVLCTSEIRGVGVGGGEVFPRIRSVASMHVFSDTCSSCITLALWRFRVPIFQEIKRDHPLHFI